MLTHSDVGEVDGVRLVTEAATVVARQWGGKLRIKLERDEERREPPAARSGSAT